MTIITLRELIHTIPKWNGIDEPDIIMIRTKKGYGYDRDVNATGMLVPKNDLQETMNRDFNDDIKGALYDAFHNISLHPELYETYGKMRDYVQELIMDSLSSKNTSGDTK